MNLNSETIVSPKIFLRVMDMSTGENIDIAQENLVSLDISRHLDSPSTCNFVLDNGRGQFCSDKGTSLWNLLDKFMSESSGPHKTSLLKSRPYPNLDKSSIPSGIEQEFFQSILYGDEVFSEASQDRTILANQIIGKVRRGEPISSSELKSLYECNLAIALKARVEVDIVDYRGYVFPAFTGFVTGITESKTGGNHKNLTIDCADFLHLWTSSLFINRTSYFTYSYLQEELLNQGLNSESLNESILMNRDPADCFKILASNVNIMHSCNSFLRSISQPVELAVRDEDSGFLWTTSKPVSLRTPSGMVSVKPRFVYKDSIWYDKPRPYITDYFDGSKPYRYNDSGYDRSKFRGPGMLFYDMSFSSTYRAHVPKALKASVRQATRMYQLNSSTAMEQMNPILTLTLGQFYCNGKGDLIFNIPHLNSLPSTKPSWDSFYYNETDYGYGGLIPPEILHGNEYIIPPSIRTSFSRTQGISGKYSRVRLVCGIHYIDSNLDAANASKKPAYVAPEPFQAIFGSQEYSASLALTGLPNSTAHWYGNSLLSSLNWRTNQVSIQINRMKCIEPGKMMYLPDYNWMYRVSQVSYSYNRGSSCSMTLSGDYGHNANTLIPIPWVQLYSGDIGSPKVKKAIKDCLTSTNKDFVSAVKEVDKNYKEGSAVATGVIFNKPNEDKLENSLKEALKKTISSKDVSKGESNGAKG